MTIPIRHELFPRHPDVSLDVTEFAAAAWHILTPQSDLSPKILTMIEMFAVTEFVNNDIPC